MEISSFIVQQRRAHQLSLEWFFPPSLDIFLEEKKMIMFSYVFLGAFYKKSTKGHNISGTIM